jgi:ribonuclease P protein component
MSGYRFPKTERLRHQKEIQELFARGSSFYLYPFRITLRNAPAGMDSHQVLITVAKRHFKRAVDRNLIKRRVRECYRLNKHQLSDMPGLQIAYIYTANEIMEFLPLQQKVIESFNKIRTLCGEST